MKIVMKNYLKTIKQNISSKEFLLFGITVIFHLIIIVLFQTGIVPVPGDFADQTTYHEHATAIAQLLKSGTYTWGAVYPHHWYPLFLGLIYVVAGPHMLWGMIANAFLIACSAVLLFRLGLFFKARSKTIFWISLFAVNGYASLLYTSSLLLKEAWIIFLLLLMLYITTRMIRLEKFSVSLFVILMISFVSLRSLRFFIALAAIAGFFVVWFLCSKISLKKRIISGVCMFVCVTAISYWLTGFEQLGKTNSLFEYVQPKFIQDLRDDYYKGGSTTTNIGVVQVTTKPQTVVSTTNEKPVETQQEEYSFSIQGLLVSAATMMFGPFPWQVSLRQYIFAFPDIFVWYVFLALAIVAVYVRRSKESLLIIVSIAVILGGLTLGVDNMGALLRYRIPIVILLAILAPIGAEHILGSIRRYIQRYRHENSLHHN